MRPGGWAIVPFLFAASVARAQSGESPYIFAIHEPGGEHHMAEKGRKGWIVFTEEVGRNAGDYSGKDFSPWSSQGYGVIVRINHGYGTSGTVPYAKHYDAFAQRVARYVAASRGARIWIIGNESNHPQEWPAYEGPVEPITAAMYAQVFKKCRDRIKATAGHEGDQVITQGTAPWNVQVGQGWVEYHAEVLARLGSGGLDGIAIHTYTHGTDPNLIYSSSKMAAPWGAYYYNFYAYRDFMNSHPTWARSLPVYLTEMDQSVPTGWADVNSGWVRNAYGEINYWNTLSGTQKIRCAALYRWPRKDKSYIDGKWGVIQDWRDAMNNNYRWNATTPVPPPPAPGQPDVIVTSLAWSGGLFTSVVKNQGGAATPTGVSIGVGYLVDGVYRTWGAVAGPLAAGTSVTVGTNGGAFTIPTGTHTIAAVADDVNRFVESIESNNSLSQTITIGASPPPPSSAGEDFETMPAWASTFSASWGGAASWAIVGGGQSGNGLQASRSGAGSSSRILQRGVPAGAQVDVSVYIKCPAGSGYWAECAARPGAWSAQDFDANAAAWTIVKKFDGTQNGNSGGWTRYSVRLGAGTSTQMSVGFKLGSTGAGAPIVAWDTLRIETSQVLAYEAEVPMEEAPPVPEDSGGGGSCGLLGIETLLLWGVVLLRRRSMIK